METALITLYKNPRYRLLKIDGQHYLVDMGDSFWKTIFPFLFWLVPINLYKVDNDIAEQLKIPPQKRNKIPGFLPIAIVAILAPNAPSSLVEYFDITMPFWVIIMLLILAIMSTIFIFLAISNRFKNKLSHTVQLDSLPFYKIKLHPKSRGHVCTFFLLYLFFIALSTIFYIFFVIMQNIFLLCVASVAFFLVLYSRYYPTKEGMTTVDFLE